MFHPGNFPVQLMEPQHYRTFRVNRPLTSHWRLASCEEYQCQGFLNGFVTTIDLGTELGQKQYDFLTHDRTRSHSMQKLSMTLIKFVYGPGNNCFSSGDHRIIITRPPRLLVVGGDWRGNPTREARQHTRIEHWAEDFSENQDKLITAIQRG